MSNASHAAHILHLHLYANTTSPADTLKKAGTASGEDHPFAGLPVRKWSLPTKGASADQAKTQTHHPEDQSCCSSCAALAQQASPDDVLRNIPSAVLIGLFVGSGFTLAALRS